MQVEKNVFTAELNQFAQEHQLGSPLKIYRVKPFYISAIALVGIFCVSFSIAVFILIIDSLGTPPTLGFRSLVMGWITSVIFGPFLLLFLLPRERRRMLIICESGLLSFGPGKKSIPIPILWSQVYLDWQNIFPPDLVFSTRIHLHDFQNSEELIEYIQNRQSL